MPCRPYTIGRHVPHIAPLSIVVARSIIAPAIDREIVVFAASTSRVADNRRIRCVSKKADTRLWGVCCLELAHRRFVCLARNSRRLIPVLDTLHNESTRNAFLKHELGGPHKRVSMKATLPHVAAQCIVKRDQTHPDVMSHACVVPR